MSSGLVRRRDSFHRSRSVERDTVQHKIRSGLDAPRRDVKDDAILGARLKQRGYAVRINVCCAALGLEGRDASNPLRVACVVSGGNPDPAQAEALRNAAD